MERPTYHGGRNSRELTRYWRKCSAWDMAHILGDVTRESYEAAYKLLDRCTRWALKQTRHDENETEFNHDKYWYVHEGELLDDRRDRLNEELAPYGCKLMNLGYFCQNVYQMDEQSPGCVKGYGLLHFFEY